MMIIRTNEWYLWWSAIFVLHRVCVCLGFFSLHCFHWIRPGCLCQVILWHAFNMSKMEILFKWFVYEKEMCVPIGYCSKFWQWKTIGVLCSAHTHTHLDEKFCERCFAVRSVPTTIHYKWSVDMKIPHMEKLEYEQWTCIAGRGCVSGVWWQ